MLTTRDELPDRGMSYWRRTMKMGMGCWEGVEHGTSYWRRILTTKYDLLGSTG